RPRAARRGADHARPGRHRRAPGRVVEHVAGAGRGLMTATDSRPRTDREQLPRPVPGARRVGTLAWVLAAAVPAVFLTVFFLYPAGTLIVTGFVADGRLDLSGVADVLGRSRTWRLLGLTLGQAVAGTALSLALGL